MSSILICKNRKYTKPSINVFILFGILFISVYFPKYGIIDTSIIGIILGFVCLICNKEIKINKSLNILIGTMILTLIYSLLIFLLNINEHQDLYLVFKMFRSTLFLMFFTVFFSNFNVASGQMVNIILGLLVLNSIFVLIQVVFPASQHAFASFTGYNKQVFPLRGFGLISGFDGAGLFALAGLCMIYIIMKIKYKINLLIYFLWLILSLSVLFTGRLSMLLGCFVHLFFLSLFILRGDFKLKLFSTINIFFIGIIAFYYILPLIIITINAFGYYNFDVSYVSELTINKSFNIHNTNVYTDLLIYPETEIKLFFGSAITPIFDYGYLMHLHLVGIVGMIFYLFLIIYILIKLLMISQWDLNIKIMKYFALTYVILLVFYNLKSSVIYGRVFFDLMWIILCFLFIGNQTAIDKLKKAHD